MTSRPTNAQAKKYLLRARTQRVQVDSALGIAACIRLGLMRIVSGVHTAAASPQEAARVTEHATERRRDRLGVHPLGRLRHGGSGRSMPPTASGGRARWALCRSQRRRLAHAALYTRRAARLAHPRPERARRPGCDATIVPPACRGSMPCCTWPSTASSRSATTALARSAKSSNKRRGAERK